MTRQRTEKDAGEARLPELSDNELEKATGGSKSSSKSGVGEIKITKVADKASSNLFME